MSFWTAFGSIFGGSETVQKTVQDTAAGVLKLTDNAFYTDQEKAANRAQALPFLLSLYQTTQNENSGTSLARRWFLLVITVNQLVMAWIYFMASLWGNDGACKAILDMADRFKLGWAFVAAVAFYFMTHAFQAITQNQSK